MIKDLETIHRNTVSILKYANEQIDDPQNRLWYNGEFYSGSLNPKLLFVGFNPGYGREDWPDRPNNLVSLESHFEVKPIKYIEEKDKARLAKQIFFMLSCTNEDPEQFLLDNVAETNFIHFNTPDIALYNKSLSLLDAPMRQEIVDHFSNAFKTLIEKTSPKVLFINGKTTFEQLKRKIPFENFTILESDKRWSLVCATATIKGLESMPVFISKHLSSPMSDDQLGSISVHLMSLLMTDWSCRDEVLKAVKENGRALKYVSEELRGDREIVLEAVKNNADALQYASDELRSDREIVLEALNYDGDYLKYASEELRGDREIVLKAQEKSHWAFLYASEELRGDREFNLEILKNDVWGIESVNKKFLGDCEFVREALKYSLFILRYASEELRGDRELILEMIKTEECILLVASEELQGNREIILEAVKNYGLALKFASKELKADREVVLAAANESGLALKYASDELLNDPEIIKLAIESDNV
ncbi:MAG: hypothetical protein QG617_757 [Campylobacterota bacterium]|nr:hypothetical protein [Campylobacterota bacterium]